MSAIKIIYAIKSMPVGGSQTHLVQVLKLLDRRRFDPMLCCLTGEGSLLDAARAAGVRVIDGEMHSGFKGWQTLAGVLNFARFLRRERVQIVHNYLLRANVVGAVAARLARVPVVLCSKRGCHE
ncbi:MAG TPA: glycosyltransferase, partial [Candidatus Binatia bacterium]|nr:glycosyltransferase [Candidatus Binatia bacterium]